MATQRSLPPLPLSQEERTEVRGSRLQPHTPESTLTRPLSLAKGEATRLHITDQCWQCGVGSIVKLDVFPFCRRTTSAVSRASAPRDDPRRPLRRTREEIVWLGTCAVSGPM